MTKQHLAKAHKIVAALKMDDLTYTHLSLKKENEDMFYISPFGIQFKNVTPKDLLCFNLNGELVCSSLSNKNKPKFNKTGFAIHSSVYKARKDINSVIHLHTKETIAVGSCKTGLLPVSQHAIHFYERVSYNSYDAQILDQKTEEDAFIRDLGQNKVMFLRNHGFITLGKTIWEALFYAYHLQKACEVQILIKDDFVTPDHETCIQARDQLLSFEEDLGLRDFKSFKF